MSTLDELKKRLGLRQIPWIWGLLDRATVAPTVLAAAHLRLVRRLGIRELPRNRAALLRIGLLPVPHHYYEPFVRPGDLELDLGEPRDIPGVLLDDESAWALLSDLEQFAHEPLHLATDPEHLRYQVPNGTYGLADGRALYGLLRKRKPRVLIEVGSGNSTLVARRALAVNAEEGSSARHLCIEPYEMPWLERSGVELVRERVERLPVSTFDVLGPGDVLFIDNSHIIRPQGDVLHLVQRIFPRLKPGVWVHIHDIFTPRDYPAHWMFDKMLLWNEQYLVETAIGAAGHQIRLPLNHLWVQDAARYRRMLKIDGPCMAPTALWVEFGRSA